MGSSEQKDPNRDGARGMTVVEARDLQRDRGTDAGRQMRQALDSAVSRMADAGDAVAALGLDTLVIEGGLWQGWTDLDVVHAGRTAKVLVLETEHLRDLLDMTENGHPCDAPCEGS